MAQRKVGNSRIQADAPGTLGCRGQQDGRIRADQCMVWGEVSVMFTDPIGVETELVGINDLIKKLLITCTECARTIFVIIEHREQAKLHHDFLSSAEVEFPSSYGWLLHRNPCRRPPCGERLA